MLPLAEWTMRGRGQALAFVVIALATSPIIWPNSLLAAAIIALAWLRLGTKEGLFLCLWAVLPATVLAVYMGSFMPLLTVITTAVVSHVLRTTRSWPFSLVALSACGLVTAIGLEAFAKDLLSEYVTVYSQFLTELKQQIPDQELNQVLMETLETAFIAGLFGTLLMIGSFISLTLARSWQAKLYNPGGFQQEFHQLRLGKIDIVIAVVLTVAFYQLGMQYLTWVWIALFPLLIAGVALFHAFAKSRKLAMQWYILFYCVLVFWDPLKIMLVIVAIADSAVNFRSRFPQHDTDTER